MFNDMLAFGFVGGYEWIVILVVALLIFGKRLPEIARSLGKSLTEFKKGISDVEETRDEIINDVNKAKKDFVNDVKDASGMNELDKK